MYGAGQVSIQDVNSLVYERRMPRFSTISLRVRQPYQSRQKMADINYCVELGAPA